jgi:hypothetical protein
MSEELERRIDEALEGERRIDPSPWFRRGVMAKVRMQAEMPPIAFPWKRVLAAIALAVVAVVASLSAPAAHATPRIELFLPVVVTLARSIRAPEARLTLTDPGQSRDQAVSDLPARGRRARLTWGRRRGGAPTVRERSRRWPVR